MTSDELASGSEIASELVSRLRGTSSGSRPSGRQLPECPLLLEQRDARVGQQPVQLRFHPSRRLVQRPPGRRPQQEVQADREDTLVAALQRVAQPLGVLQTDVALGVGDALRQHIDAARRLEFGDLQTERSHHVCRMPAVECAC